MIRKLLFNLWYFQRHPLPWDTGISPPELVDFIRQNPPGRALDLGCGTGTNVITLARHGWEANGVDFAWRAIRLARRKAREAGVQARFEVGDVTRLHKPPASFDLILDIGCFHSLSASGREAYLRQAASLLAPNGAFLLYAFIREGFSRSGSGLVEAELEEIASHMELVQRKDGSERGQRPSAWLLFRSPKRL